MLASCKKDTVPWEWCSDCTSETLAGNYEGTAKHLKYLDTIRFVETRNNPTYLNITLDGGMMVVENGVINLFAQTISGGYNNTYYIEMASGQERFSANVYKSGNKIKILGTAKKLGSQGNVNQLLDFEVYKKND